MGSEDLTMMPGLTSGIPVVAPPTTNRSRSSSTLPSSSSSSSNPGDPSSSRATSPPTNPHSLKFQTRSELDPCCYPVLLCPSALERLPNDVLWHVLSCGVLSLKEIQRLTRVSRAFQLLVEAEPLWWQLARRHGMLSSPNEKNLPSLLH